MTVTHANELLRRITMREKQTALAKELGTSRYTVHDYAPIVLLGERVAIVLKKTILCVDADQQTLSVRQFVPATRGYAVKTALDTAQGTRLLREGDVDLVLSSNAQVVREAQRLALLIPGIYVAGKRDLHARKPMQ